MSLLSFFQLPDYPPLQPFSFPSPPSTQAATTPPFLSFFLTPDQHYPFHDRRPFPFLRMRSKPGDPPSLPSSAIPRDHAHSRSHLDFLFFPFFFSLFRNSKWFALPKLNVILGRILPHEPLPLFFFYHGDRESFSPPPFFFPLVSHCTVRLPAPSLAFFFSLPQLGQPQHTVPPFLCLSFLHTTANVGMNPCKPPSFPSPLLPLESSSSYFFSPPAQQGECKGSPFFFFSSKKEELSSITKRGSSIFISFSLSFALFSRSAWVISSVSFLHPTALVVSLFPPLFPYLLMLKLLLFFCCSIPFPPPPLDTPTLWDEVLKFPSSLLSFPAGDAKESQSQLLPPRGTQRRHVKRLLYELKSPRGPPSFFFLFFSLQSEEKREREE